MASMSTPPYTITFPDRAIDHFDQADMTAKGSLAASTWKENDSGYAVSLVHDILTSDVLTYPTWSISPDGGTTVYMLLNQDARGTRRYSLNCIIPPGWSYHFFLTGGGSLTSTTTHGWIPL